MRTVTISFETKEAAQAWIQDGEDRGWSVRSLTPSMGVLWVVLEKPQPTTVHKTETKWLNRAAQYMKGLAE